MARGWESKDVESQQELAAERAREGPLLTPEEQTRRRELATLTLDRTRVANDLARAVNPRYRAQLEAALRHLEERITALGCRR
jgi:hypothetical protein